MHLAIDQPQHTTTPVQTLQVETLLEKGSGVMNEDALVNTGEVFAVLDGATSLDDCRYLEGMTGGRIAATTAARILAGSDNSLVERTTEANRQIRHLQRQVHIGVPERHKLWSTSVAAVRIRGEEFEYCQSGDALILLLIDDGTYKLLTPEIDIDTETLQLLQAIPASQPLSTSRELAEQIRRVRAQMNISYGVLNGEDRAMNFLRHGRQSLAGVSDMLLFTDGLFLPRETPGAEHDWAEFVDLYRRGGLGAIHRQVRAIQADDPGCRRFPRFKQHDDIAAVAVTF